MLKIEMNLRCRAQGRAPEPGVYSAQGIMLRLLSRNNVSKNYCKLDHCLI